MWLIELLTIAALGWGWGCFAAALKGAEYSFLQCSGVGLPYFVRGAPTSFVLWVKPFVRANVEWSDILDKISVFEEMHASGKLSSFSKFSAEFCVARDIN